MLALLLTFGMANVHSLSYIFRRTNILERREYWEDSVVPCKNDQIYFSEDDITTAFIGDGLISQKIDLPTNGILFFGEKTTLGKSGSWQCEGKENSEAISFKRSPSLGFYNGSNWIVSGNGIEWKPALHVLQVPSSQDTAIIPSDSGTRVLIEDYVTVGALVIAGREMNNDTYNDSFLRSIEGQFQFDLAPKLKSLLSIDGIDHQWPKFRNTVTIMGEKSSRNNVGQFNSNLEAEKLALICSYRQCQPTTVLKCRKMFQPIGHCCHICGSMFRFRAIAFNFDKFQKQIGKYKRENAMLKEYDLDISSLCIDRNESLPQYQIVVLAREGATRQYDEQIHYDVLKILTEFVQNNFGIPHSMMITEVEQIISENFNNFDKGYIIDFASNLVLAIISLLIISSSVIAVILAVGKKFDFTNFRGLSNHGSVYGAVRWRNVRTADELELQRNDRTTLTNATHANQDLMKSMPENTSIFENVAFDAQVSSGMKSD